MTQTEILNSNENKTWKIKNLLELGLSRREVSNLMNCGYGFVQNVFAQTYPDRVRSRTIREIIEEATYGLSNFPFNHKFGVEIEAFNIDRFLLARKLNEAGINTTAEDYNHTTRNYWKVITDSSITGTNTFEVVSPILKGLQGLEQLKIVCKILKENNAKVNKTTGLHLHFNASEFEFSTWKNLTKNYILLESTIDSFMPVSRRESNNRFCKSMKVENWESKLNQATTLEKLYSTIGRSERYTKINYESFWRHKSVEFRQHSGTFEYEKISNWILFLARLIEFSKDSTLTIGNFEDMKNFLPDEVINYFQQRKEQLA